jgi:hypothetical protein
MDPTENSLSIVEVHLPRDHIATVAARTYRKQVIGPVACYFIGELAVA